MDNTINVDRLSRQLYQRGTHRLLGNPFLGSMTAFLTVLFLIRLAANFYIIFCISNKGSRIDAVQVASAHLVFLSAYALWVGALASCRISLALPQLCFVNFALHGRRFRSKFMHQIAFLRPMNIACLSLMFFTVVVFSIICRNWQLIVVRGLIVICSTLLVVTIMTAVASRSVRSRSDIQIMEILYLLFLVSLNPDIGSFDGRASIFFRGTYCSFSSVAKIGSAIALIVIVALLVLLVVRVLSAMNNLFRRQISLSPMERWYWRFLRIRLWAFLYVVIAPVFISSAVSPDVKRWTLVLSILFGVASYLYFITYCDNSLREKWRCSLSDKGNIGLITRSVLTHVVLMMIPVLGYIFLK
jgi:hypothetical protein